MTTQDLLVELLTEELPPKALNKLSTAFANGVYEALTQLGLAGSESQRHAYATPRRLAVSISNVVEQAADVTRRDKVLPVSVGLDVNGQATASLTKKLTAMGFPDKTPADLDIENDGKQDVFFISYTQKGAILAEVLQTVLSDVSAKLPIPKVMTYQIHAGTAAQEDVQFVRPVKRALVLWGDDVLPVTVFGVKADRLTDGHRFMSEPALSVKNAADYTHVLRNQGMVEPDFKVRRESIYEQLKLKADAHQVIMPDELLDEVTALTEWPVVYKASFDESFLSVPQECLILTMQTNQKYFAMTDATGALVNEFLVISNILTDEPDNIIEGNARVVRPRLADAQFFFEQDKKKSLDNMVAKLSNVVYHNKLGSQGERVTRVKNIAAYLATALNANVANAQRAATIAKADLVSDMVGEFPELQGVMGRYYATHHGESADVAAACAEHYQPRFAGDELPATTTGLITALADKLETLVGIWGIGLQPTGEKDPFALRRHALGVVRMILEKRLPLSLSETLAAVQSEFNDNMQVKNSEQAVKTFMLDRLKGMLKDQGYAPAHIEAVLSNNPDRLDEVEDKLAAVKAFAVLPEATNLAAANKRCVNILRKATEKDEAIAPEVDKTLLSESAEQALANAVEAVRPSVQTAIEQRAYQTALTSLASLREPVDAFFVDVMVMVDDAAVRANRLKLLQDLAQLMNGVADISQLAV
ncbi:glycine--tRNA ligase beta subunit [Formosimonas limnophila]|uniref:Glycine--tRNA ligase beta subunit n=1 Tax=Formosimonas limnophila TaxID=1384487 RepID=A0A8J3CLT1_9BURK|nr:glycine--tRNA ligase subunit beta [Formosimonas limnophila]GHA68214.1 glycine--tRNA ligase beta subunit [Formosimonas limnophila]